MDLGERSDADDLVPRRGEPAGAAGSGPSGEPGEGGESAERALRRDRLLGEYIDRLNAGERIDPLEVIALFPEDGDEILADIEAFVGAPGRDPAGSSDPGAGEERFAGGRRIGDYSLGRRLGRGGMGVVYEAWQGSMERPVALKVLPVGVAADHRTFLRFCREARLAGKLRHANIVPVFGMGIDGDTPHYAMELVDGETLARVLEREREEERRGAGGAAREPLMTGDAYRLAEAFAEVADALRHAHSLGVVHRDIKPSNLILERGGRLRLLDFGLARLDGQAALTASGDLLGTPSYMSPEQASARAVKIDHRTDIYSLGATLYEMLTRRPPFRGKSARETLSQILERDPLPPRVFSPRIPVDLEKIVLKCLRKDPVDRYGTAEALGQDLLRFVRGDPVEARPESRWDRWARRLRRHRGKIVAGVAVSLVLLGSGWSVWVERAEREEMRRVAARLAHDGVVVEAAKDLLRGQLLLPGYETGVEGLGYFRAWRYQRGIESARDTLRALEEAAEAAPERPDAPFYLARFYRLLGEEEAAREQASRALRRDGDFVPAAVLLAQIDRGLPALDEAGYEELLGRARAPDNWQEPWLRAREDLRAGSWKGAAAAFDRLLAWRERHGEPYLGCAVEAYMGCGLARLRLGDHEAAIRCFTAARTLWTRFPEAWVYLAKAYHRAGRREEALMVSEAFYAAVEDRDKNETASWFMLAYASLDDPLGALKWAHRITGWEGRRVSLAMACQSLRLETCLEGAREVLREHPEDRVTRLFAELALSFLQFGRGGATWDARRRELLSMARESRDLYPLDSELRSLHAAALALTGSLEPALSEARSALELARRFGSGGRIVFTTLGLVLRLRGELSEADSVLRRALERLPSDPFVRVELARVLEESGRDEDALQEYRRAAEPRGAWAVPHVYLARLLNRLGGRSEEAARAAREAIGRRPPGSGGEEELALALWRLGRREESLEQIRAGLEVAPDRPRLHLVRAAIQEDRGEVIEAARSCCRALELDPELEEAHQALGALLERGAVPPDLPELARLEEALDARAPPASAPALFERTFARLRAARQ